MTHASRRQSGFSLLELILAMTVAAMLALTLYTAMNVTNRARRTAARAVEATRGAAVAADLLRQDLESVPPPTGILAGPFYGIHQAGEGGGDADTMQFSTIGADAGVPVDVDAPMTEGIRRVELLVRADVTPPVLVRRVTRNLLASTEPLVEEEIVCRNVRSFSLRYYDGYAWQENWDSTTLGDVLPMSVSLTLEVGDEASGVPLRRVSRVVSLACAKPSDVFSMGGVP